ncbi:MAG: glycosyltransferase family 4 protein [bacterium]
MARLLIFGDFIPTGFGRICRAAALHLGRQGHEIMGACIQYDGLLPLGLPFHVAALNGRDHGAALTGIWTAYQPDVVLSVQDFPYHIMARHATGIDWSTTAQIVITPVDGVPIYRDWLDNAKQFDALLTISEFGVEAFRKAGVTAGLCAPGVDVGEFHRLDDATRAALRQKMGLPADAFIVGVMAMNQGRKAFPSMVQGFADAFPDVPNAYLFLDCEKVSPAGWDIPKQLIAECGLDPARVRYREDALRAGVQSLNERYNLLDVHMVIAHREGFGLPHIEAMATGIPTVALDYCSGREIIGDQERGLLVRARPDELGTWGGARDYSPDMAHLVEGLRALYDQPAERLAKGARALEWAKGRTWEKAASAVADILGAVVTRRAADLERKRQKPAPTPTAQPSIPAGVAGQSIHLHAPVYVMANDPAGVAAGIGKAVGQQVELLEGKREHAEA